MNEIVEIDLGDGTSLLAEVAVAGGDVGAWDRFTLSAVKSAIGRIARWTKEKLLQDLPEPPDRVEIEFGMKFAVQTGELVSVLAEASGEASIIVRVEWNHKAQ
ncbi:CU044_2847 family protein [Nakamurella sp. GG22]